MSIANLDLTEVALEITDSTIPVAVNFWAEWCGPCKTNANILEALTLAYEGKIKFIKVNVSLGEAYIASNYDIKNVPTLALFNRGREVGRFIGSKPVDKFEEFLDKYL